LNGNGSSLFLFYKHWETRIGERVLLFPLLAKERKAEGKGKPSLLFPPRSRQRKGKSTPLLARKIGKKENVSLSPPSEKGIDNLKRPLPFLFFSSQSDCFS